MQKQKNTYEERHVEEGNRMNPDPAKFNAVSLMAPHGSRSRLT
jgi:hypothetical protein